MGRIAEKNPRYRTKEQMALDVAAVLSSSLSFAAKYAVLADTFWQWTEFYGKYNGCPYWTVKAVEEFKSNPLPNEKKYRHEHIVPKRVLNQLLFEMPPQTNESIFNFLSIMNIGVVVTREEDNLLNVDYRMSMPPEFHEPSSGEFHDPWLRYKRCGVMVVDRRNSDTPVVS